MRLSYAQAAQHIGIKVGTLRSLVCRKQVPHIRLTGRLVVFDRDQLDAWLAGKAVPAIGATPPSARPDGLTEDEIQELRELVDRRAPRMRKR